MVWIIKIKKKAVPLGKILNGGLGYLTGSNISGITLGV